MELWTVRTKGETGLTIGCRIGDTKQRSYWTSPPESIDHVDMEYLKGRYPMITTEKRATEFKRKYKELFVKKHKPWAEIQDQFILMYVKDGTVYPVALSKDQLAVFEMMLQVMSAEKPISVIGNRPQGQAEFLKVGGNNE